MVSGNISTIIDKTCKNKQLDKEVMTSMMNFVFSETREEMAKYEELSIYLPGLVIFFYGKKRLIKLKEELENLIVKVKENGISDDPSNYLEKMSVEQLEFTLAKVQKLLLRYEEYIDEKRRTKQAYKESKVQYFKHKGVSSGEL